MPVLALILKALGEEGGKIHDVCTGTEMGQVPLPPAVHTGTPIASCCTEGVRLSFCSPLGTVTINAMR